MFNHHLRELNSLPFLKKQLNEIYVVHSLDAFVFSLIGIFVPIYLLILGYSISEVLAFYIIKQLAVCVFSFLAGYISTHLGLKHTMLMRFPVVSVFLIMLYSLGSVALPLALIAVLGGLQTALYWMPLHSLFSRSSDRVQMGTEVGRLHSFPKLASVTAPLIGGFIAIFFGFSTLFIAAMAILAVSAITLFYTPEVKPHVNFKVREGIAIFKKYPKYFFAVGVNHLGGMAESVIWPIFVYLTLANVLSIGIVGTLLSAGTVIFTLMTGRFSDRFDRRVIIKTGAILMALVWSLRFFASSETIIYLLTVMAGFFTVLIIVPFASVTYNLARKGNIDEFIIFREIPVALGRISILLLAMLFFKQQELTFLFAGISHLFLLFL
jgi:MFS family permease